MTSNHVLPQAVKRFYPDKDDQRYRGLHPPYESFRWLLDQKRYADGLVYWCQENAWLDFHKSDGDLSPFATALPSSNLVCLKVADNAYITKGMTEALAKLLLDLQSQGRIVIGRQRNENLRITVEPDNGDEPIHFLRAALLWYPRPIRAYKRPRRLDIVVRIYLGPTPWPEGNTAENWWDVPEFQNDDTVHNGKKGATDATG